MEQITNSFDGVIHEIPQISVDNFEDYNKKAYFLSHCHSDHSYGLYKKQFLNNLNNTNSKIYMSALSAEIVKQESKIYDRNEILVNYIVPLDLGEKLIINLDENDKDEMIVTLIPVDHCLGSVMFLFEKDNKNILFTGDFRITDISNIQQYFHIDGKRIAIHKLYVDTTFQDPKYEHFPEKSESINCAVGEIRKWLDTKINGRILLQTSGNYIAEQLFNEIYDKLKVKVYVQDEKLWGVYSMLESPVPGVTNNETETTIILCKNKKGQVEFHEYCDWNQFDQCLHIHFFALNWMKYEQNTSAFFYKRNNCLKVLFATHCSSSELNNFVKFLQPQDVVGFPKPFIKLSQAEYDSVY